MLDAKILAPLRGAKVATVKSYREVTNSKGGYVEVVLKLDDRDYTYILFPGKGATAGKQINYFVSALRNQWDLEGETTLRNILEQGKTKEFKVWFSYNELYNRMNVGFHEPAVTEHIDLDEVEA